MANLVTAAAEAVVQLSAVFIQGGIICSSNSTWSQPLTSFILSHLVDATRAEGAFEQ